MLSFPLLNSLFFCFYWIALSLVLFFFFSFIDIRTQFLHLNLCLVCLGNIQSIIFILGIDSNCLQAQAGDINEYRAGIGKHGVAGTGKSLGGPRSLCRHSEWEFAVLCKVNKTVVHATLGPGTVCDLWFMCSYLHTSTQDI